MLSWLFVRKQKGSNRSIFRFTTSPYPKCLLTQPLRESSTFLWSWQQGTNLSSR